MKLNETDLKRFDDDGFLFLPGLFSEDEAQMLMDEAQAIYKQDREEVWRESSGVARTAFAAHTYSEPFRRLGRHPRLVEPVEQLLGEKLYMHQYKINAKAAFDGEVWQWHQDYGTWARDDGMPEPRAMNIAVFLEDVTPANGPLLFIPKSHKQGVLEAGHDLETTSYPLWTLDREAVSRLAAEGGCEAPIGPKGSVVMFHGNLVHASPPNISPLNRTIVYLSLCAVSNHITKFTRKEWIAHRDFTPIESLEDDCLRELVDNRAAVAAE
ncbi:phytanoyl-CoA dioxygenase family protein [Marivibrio halodurans]|uniref:Phytanoyl-CoA dioxygenase family protein n=1 Tax=Marivibrio halodurans TaxID=2039722 RepID=A0A8J7S1R3_9PROT|nr:phytanoyl-CoA dioxygenase family protein [Marivibrio halodurans]MBP5858752.1 phytanoyl-CoA dioxygenase family protein [Marivibrio halodurans]